MHDPKKWHQIKLRVDQIKHKLQAKFPGHYLLIHVETGKLSFGSIADDVKNGGHIDACLNHQLVHGKLQVHKLPTKDLREQYEPLWGEYFGIKL